MPGSGQGYVPQIPGIKTTAVFIFLVHVAIIIISIIYDLK